MPRQRASVEHPQHMFSSRNKKIYIDSRYPNLAYLEVKIWSLPKHENLTTGEKYCGKEEKLLPRSNFSSFPQYFQYISNFKSPITYTFVKYDCSNYVFLNSANLICWSTDISKYFRESLGIRDNESGLCIYFLVEKSALSRVNGPRSAAAE